MSTGAGMGGNGGAHDGQRRGLLARVAGVATERIVDTVDPDIIIDHVDVERLLARIDLNALLDRIDVERLIDRVDVKAVVERAGVPEMVAASTGHLAESGLDLARRQAVGLDLLLARAADRLARRPPRSRESSPPALAEPVPAPDPGAPAERLSVTGHYAGAVSRSLAAVLDVTLVTATWTLAVAAADYLLTLLGVGLPDLPRWCGALAIGTWGFTYVWMSVAVAGRTPGKALLGLRVVRADGTFVPPGRSFVRAGLWWVSVAIAWVALVPVVLGRSHRAAHDLVAGTAVVHDWGDRPAELTVPLSAFLRRSGQGAD